MSYLVTEWYFFTTTTGSGANEKRIAANTLVTKQNVPGDGIDLTQQRYREDFKNVLQSADE
jgi:hypothetical protein